MSESADVLIVGAGHAGAQVAIALRQRKFRGSVTIVGDEPELPYERPPLSKDYLSGEKPFERVLLRPEAFWREREIVMKTGRRVVKVHPDTHEVTLHTGDVMSYRHLIWATGGSARCLNVPGNDLNGVHSIRKRADVDLIRRQLPGVRRVAVIGGGYIGLEAAAVLTQLDRHVTIIEVVDRVLARVAGEQLSRFYEGEHRARGVALRLGAQVGRVTEMEGRATGVQLASGEVVPADIVLVGIGIVPAVQPLLDAGARGGNGVAVDRFCRTDLPEVHAIGDCALHANEFSASGYEIRLESVQNATDMAMTVARDITGDPQPYQSVPWFWSHQYDLRLQTVGLSAGHDETILNGDIAAGSFSIEYLKDGHVIAVDCVNNAREFQRGRTLVMRRSWRR